MKIQSARTILSTIALLALLSAHVDAQTNTKDTSNPTSENKKVTSREYRYDKVYTPLEQPTPVRGPDTESLTGQAAETNSLSPNADFGENSKSSSGTSHATSNLKSTLDTQDLKTAQRVQKYTNTTKLSSSISVVSTNQFWIYDSWVGLVQDIDYDGYYSQFSVEFDADTIFANAPVYAVLYLGRNGTYDAIHVSSEFFIYGEDSTDSFVIESTLVSGFPSYDYDILLELYDAQTEQLVAFSDSYDNPEFAFVPLESETNEYVVEESVVIVQEHGGSLSWMTLFFGFLMLLGRALVKPTTNKAKIART